MALSGIPASLIASTYGRGLAPALPDFGELSRAVPVPYLNRDSRRSEGTSARSVGPRQSLSLVAALPSD